MSPAPVHVIGATGRLGQALCRLLAARNTPIVAVIRTPARWPATAPPATLRQADLTNPASIQTALADATAIVSVAYAAYTQIILAAAPPTARLILTGTARRYSALPDQAGQDAARAESLLLASGRDAAILHPTMIYAGPDDGTLSRLLAVIRRFPMLPLPDAGRALVQPIHREDLAAALAAALAQSWSTPMALPIAGPSPLPYAALIRQLAQAAGLRAPLILNIPAPAIRLLARLRPTQSAPLLRLLEDRSVDIGPVVAHLGLPLRPFSASGYGFVG